MLARLTRSGMLETLSKDYIGLATSIGLPRRTINYKLALKNTLIPTVTFLGLAVGSMLGGSIIIETVFGWPGLGHLAVTALLSKDLYAVTGGESFVGAGSLQADRRGVCQSRYRELDLPADCPDCNVLAIRHGVDPAGRHIGR